MMQVKVGPVPRCYRNNSSALFRLHSLPPRSFPGRGGSCALESISTLYSGLFLGCSFASRLSRLQRAHTLHFASAVRRS